jgi:cobalt-zinc-cadmium efflux system protein
MRSVLLDTIADAVTSAAVAVCGAVILIANGLYWIDSVVALGISAVVGYTALRLIKDVAVALRHGEPVTVRDDD